MYEDEDSEWEEEEEENPRRRRSGPSPSRRVRISLRDFDLIVKILEDEQPTRVSSALNRGNTRPLLDIVRLILLSDWAGDVFFEHGIVIDNLKRGGT